MALFWPEPAEENGFLKHHVALMLQNFQHWTGRELIDKSGSWEERARELFYAPFVVVSHNRVPDPVFNYANKVALELFEMSWEQFTSLPSRLSAPPIHRAEREHLLSEVSRNGYIADYRGIRIAKSGRRFWIEGTIIWNLKDEDGRHYGQAAMFDRWRFVE